jgi:hypothetical protein
VGSDHSNIGGFGVAVGTLLAAQLGRLIRRRETLAAPPAPPTDKST